MIKSLIRTIPDYPKPGIMFKDITTLLKDANGFIEVIDILVARYKSMGIDKVIGIESRGLIIGAPLAYALGVGFVPIRKKGKLPGPTLSQEYKLEYGEDHIEIHQDALIPNEKVLIVDDLIATGGTAVAAVKLSEKLGANVVECVFIIDLMDLGGSSYLKNNGYTTFSIVNY